MRDYKGTLRSFLSRLAPERSDGLTARAARELAAIGGYPALRSVEGIGIALKEMTASDAAVGPTALRLAMTAATSSAPWPLAAPRELVRGVVARALELPRAIGAISAMVASLEDRMSRLEADQKAILDHVSSRPPQPVLSSGGLHFTRLGDDSLIAYPSSDVRAALLTSIWGGFELGLRRYIDRTVQPGMCVVDVGANVGIISLTAARRVGAGGRVVAIEPNPGAFQALVSTLGLNDLQGRVDCRQLALGARAGRARLHAPESLTGHSTLAESSPRAGTTEFEVTVETLDAVMGEARVDLLKIDVEGLEGAVLEGARATLARNRSMKVIIEFAPELLRRAGQDPGQLLSWLETEGFGLSVIDAMTGEVRTVERGWLERCTSENILLGRA